MRAAGDAAPCSNDTSLVTPGLHGAAANLDGLRPIRACSSSALCNVTSGITAPLALSCVFIMADHLIRGT